jgi:hypothetical protein
VKYVLIILFLWGLNCYAGQYSLALKTTAKAISKTPTFRTARKQIEERVYRSLPVDKDTLKTVVPAAIALSKGELSTESFVDLKYRKNGLEIKPDIQYNIKNNEGYLNVALNYRF